ncbi:MAG: glutathione peroxidase [Flavobacteriaceae bacterium]|nr:glutathione peroxidase [Flavobacteriaceae bacterium]
MLKTLILIGGLVLLVYVIYAYTKPKKQIENQPSIYDSAFAINDLNGNPIDLKKFKGKKILFVNVASECGFTPQYADLQKLHETYSDQVTVIGLPCNQFGKQEPGTPEEIHEFCSVNFGVTFLLTEKIEVKGDNQHPLYQWLTDEKKNGLKNSSVKWNFQKYLLDENGRLIDVYYSITKPLSDSITQHFNKV